MPFDKELEPKVKHPPSLEDFRFAEQLHEAIAKQTKHRKAWSHKAWSNEFRILRQSADSIKTVLDWYCKNIGKEFTPVAHSAKMFRTKYDNIAACFKRSIKNGEDVIPSPEAISMAREHIRFNFWPSGAKQDLARITEISLGNARTFYKKVRDFKVRLSFGPKKAGLSYIDCILLSGMVDKILAQAGSPVGFTKQWLDLVHKRIMNWEGWNGKLAWFAFHEGHEMFIRMGCVWSQEKSCGTKQWFDFMEKINEKS